MYDTNKLGHMTAGMPISNNLLDGEKNVTVLDMTVLDMTEPRSGYDSDTWMQEFKFVGKK